MLDGTAKGCAELVALQRRHGRRKEIARLYLLVAQEFVGAAVKVFGAALQRRVDDRGKPVFSAHAAGQDFELLQRVGGRGDGRRAQLVFGNVEAVQEPSRVQPPVSADSKVDAVGADSLASGADIGPAGRVDCAGSQLGQLPERAAVERHVDDGGILHHLPDGRPIRDQHRSGSLNLDRFSCRPQLELDIEPCLLAYLQHDATDRAGPEAGRLGGHSVLADGEEGNRIVARLIGYSLAFESGGKTAGDDVCRGYDRAGWICDRAEQSGCGFLRGCERRQGYAQDQRHCSITHICSPISRLGCLAYSLLQNGKRSRFDRDRQHDVLRRRPAI